MSASVPTRLRWKKILVFPLFISAVLLWLLWPRAEAKAGWFDDNWLYRVAISIGNTGSADTNKKIKFDIDTATLISAGKLQSDCGDSRFTDAGGKILKYYIDGAGGPCNGASTDYYVLTESIPAGGTVIYHYYGSANAPNGTQSTQFSQGTFSPNSGPTAAGEEKSPGPVAAWSFDEGTGTNINDGTDNNYDGTLTSGPLWKKESDCISGKCLFFDGTDDYILTNSGNSVKSATAVTFSGWFKVNFLNSTEQNIYVEPRNSDGSVRFQLAIASDNKLYFGIRAPDSGSVITLIDDNRTLTANTWYHVVGVYNSATDIHSLYLNGNGVNASVSVPAFDSTAPNSAPRIGSQIGSNYFHGFMDEIKIYPYARSDSEIKADYTARGSTQGIATQFGAGGAGSGEKFSNGLTAYYPMDESAANSCTGGSNDTCDSSGNGNDGAWNGDATAAVGKYGSGVTFDGTGDYINLGTSIFSSSQLAKGTISAWFKTSQTSSTMNKNERK